MHVCKNLIKVKRKRQEEQKTKICQLEKELEYLCDKIHELEHRIAQLEIHQIRKDYEKWQNDVVEF